MSLLQSLIGARQAFVEQRRSLREYVRFPAWVDIGNGAPLRDCTVLDVSDDGVRIALAAPAELPEQFHLVLSRSGARRRCRLAWRTQQEAGLSYLEPLDRPLAGTMA